MNLKRLLALKNVDMNQVQVVLNSRTELKEGKDSGLDVDYFRRLVSAGMPIINYYSGSIDSINLLMNVSSKKNILILPSDIIEVEERFNRINRYRSDEFFSHIVDSLAQNDGYAIPETNEALMVHNIKKIKLHSFDENEEVEFLNKIKNLNLEIESYHIEQQLVTILNDMMIFKNKGVQFKDIYSIFSYLDPNVRTPQNTLPREFMVVYQKIDNYLKQGEVLDLIFSIRIVSELESK